LTTGAPTATPIDMTLFCMAAVTRVIPACDWCYPRGVLAGRREDQAEGGGPVRGGGQTGPPPAR
jgi:hypothetical protein